MKQNLQITLAQLNPIVGNLTYNKNKILEAWEKSSGDTDLVVFSELITSGYPPEDLVLKPFFMEEIRNAVNEIVQQSKKHTSAALIGCPWNIDGKTYNALHLIENGKIIATQAKCHLPNYNVFDEERIFERGPLPEPVSFRGVSLGLMICEDMWYTDVAHHLHDKGADIFIVINGSPFDIDKNNMRQSCAKTCIKNTGNPLVYVNQVGGQDELVFDGASFVMDEDGQIALQGQEFVEDLYHVTFNKTKGTPWKIESDTSTALHKSTESVYQALLLGLHDYIAKNGFPGVLIGLSGGIDSALSAILAVDALGPEAVHCVMMPSRFTSQDSLEDAAELAKNLGVKLDNISIETPVQSFNDILKPYLGKGVPDITFENIQPRSRGLILMALSNATGNMVLSTGNKSEMAVGYATLYGDMCGGFNILKDVYKTQVYELSRWRNENKPKNKPGPEGIVIPERILTKAPTAELKDNQTDQDTLPPYEELDDILTSLIEHDWGIDEIVKRGHDRQIVAKVWKMLDAAEYKRRQAPPGIKITTRSFGRDRRYPITNHFVNIIEKEGS